MRAYLTVFAFVCACAPLFSQTPGNVSPGLAIWLKANAGAEEGPADPAENGDAITRWLDQSGNGRHYIAVPGPTLENNALNFNPGVQIMGGGFDAPVGAELSTAWSLFFVSRKLPSDNNGRLFDGHTGNYLWAHWGSHRNGIYLQGNPNNYNSGIATTSGIEQLHLHSFVREDVTNTIQARADGSSLATFNGTNSASGIRIDINTGAFTGENSHSQIGEVIMYSSALSPAEVIQIESYLAIKYGLTLTHDYIASDGSMVVWDRTADPTFNNNIAVVGRDDNSGLDQRISTSSNGGYLTIDNGGAFATDLEFVALGDNNLNGVNGAVPDGYAVRSNRIWLTQLSGASGTVTVSVDLSTIDMTNTGDVSQYTLLSSATSDFPSGTTQLTSAASLVGNVVTFSNVTVNHDEYLSIAINNVGNVPGGVSPGLTVWLKANSGALEGASDPAEHGDNITTWQDASIMGNDYTAVAGPTLQDASLNFNPVVEILSGGFDAPANAALTTTWTTFFVARKLASDQSGRLFDSHAGNFLWGYWDNHRNSLYLNGSPSNHNSGIATTAGVLDPHLFTYKRSVSGSLEARADGSVLNTFGSSNSAAGMRIDINQGTNAGESSDAQVGEVIIYNSTLTNDQVERVESYLGIKYGLHLTHNYLASDGTVLWDVTVNATHHNNVAGIGRDDASTLEQRASGSVNATGSVIVTKPGPFTSDKDFLMWGSSLATGTSTNLPATGYTLRTNKTWRTQVTGNPGVVDLSVDLSIAGLPNTGNASDFTLLIDADGDFSAGATAHNTGATLNGSVLSFTNVSFSNGDYFAFAISNLQQPGGVPGTAFWVMGDVGVTGTTDVSRWADQKGVGNDALQNNVAQQPTLAPASINGHAAVNFTGTDIFQLTSPLPALNSTIFTVAATNSNSGYRTMFRSSANDHHLIMNNGNTQLGYYDGNGGFRASGHTMTAGEVAIIGLEMFTGDVNFRKNGTQGASINTIDLSGQPLTYFGNYQAGSQAFGRIGETIIYNSAAPLTTTEKEKIESYLAVKYGITLSHNVIASDGSVLWDVTANAAYNNHVAAIGRDDVTLLDQRESSSVHTGAVFGIAKTAGFGTDKDAVIVGNDLATGTSNNVPSPYFARITRVWKTAVHGTPGSVDISVNLASLGFPVTGNASDYVLLIDTDTDFSDAAAHTTGVNLVGDVVSFSGVSLTDGATFTIAAVNVPMPGGVAGSVFWVSGDVGVTGTTNVSVWADQSGMANNAVQGNASLQPALLSSDINFHNTIQFTGNTILSLTTAPTNANTTIFTVAAPVAQGNWRTMFRGIANDHPIILESNSTRLGYYDGDGGFKPSGHTWAANEVAVVSTEMYTGDVNFRKNGTQGASINTINFGTLTINYFGNYQNGAQAFGRIAETIIFNSATPLTTNEKERIESYLASKYGVTLAHDYLNSDNVVYWNVTANAPYNNHVTVVGRDDNSGFDQRSSISQHTGRAVTIVKTGAFDNDKDMLIVGSDVSTGTSVNTPAGFIARTARVWKTALRGTPGTIDISFDLVAAGLPLTGNASDYALLIDNDTDFSSGATQYTTGASLVGNTLSFTNVSFADGQFFAVAAANISLPGGVAGSAIWLKGDEGVTGTTNVTDWADQSGAGVNLTQTNAAAQPSLLTANINSHDVVSFSGSDVMQITSPPSATNSTLFVVGAPNVNSAWRTLLRNTPSNDWMCIVENNNIRAGYNDSNTGGFKASGFTWTQDEVALFGAEYQPANVSYRKNGTQGASNSSIGIAGTVTYLGGHETLAQSFGRIAEAILFTSPTSLTSQEKERIETYLAIKYGITLAHNYIASDGTVLWDITANSAYNNYIIGVGRDDVSSLDQHSSASVHTGAATTITAPGAFTNNFDNIIIGNDASIGTSINVPPGFDARALKTWKTAVRGTPGNVGISIDLAVVGLTVTGAAPDYALLIDSDTDFSSGAFEHTTGASLNGSVISFTNVSLADGQFFTIATRNMSLPAGVPGNVLWITGDDGVTASPDVSNWADIGGTGNHLTQSNSSTQPSLLASNINSHASVNFTGTDFVRPTATHALLNTTVFVVGAPVINTAWRSLMRSSINEWPIIVQQNGTQVGFYDSDGGGFRSGGLTWAQDEVALFGAEFLTGNVNFRKNGTQGGSHATINLATGNISYFGGHESSAQPFGRIAELIVFKTPNPLTAAEKERIESYLAVKYGITLTHNYVASDGTVIWDNTANSGYVNNITAIGRDDETLLDQQASQSVHAGYTISLNKGSAFPNDFDFIAVGSNTANGLSPNAPVGYVARSNRLWKASVTGSPGTVAISIDLTASGFGNTGNAADYALLIDSDTDFSSGAAIHTTGAALVGDVLTFTNVSLSHNNFIAVASSNAVLPGGVGNAVFWVRADAGVTVTTDVSQWADQTLNNNHAFQNNTSNQPTLVADAFNFNPVIDFANANDVFQITSGPANLNSTVFTVASPATTTGYKTMFRGTSSEHQIIINSGTNNLGYYDNNGSPQFKASGFTWTQNEIALVALEMRTGNVNFRKNGSQGASNATIDVTTHGLNNFGNYQSGGQRFGRIAETIIYNTSSALTTDEKNMIESYLGVKYGITLAHNYVSTNGTVTWNMTTNALYHNYVTGIGRDDVTALDQRASLSVHPGATVVMEKTGAFGANNTFLLWGNNTGAMSAAGVTDFPASEGVIARLARVWKVAVTGTPGAVNVSVDLSTVPGSKDAAHLRLLIDRNMNGLFSDETVGGGGIIDGASLVSGNTFEFTGVTFNNNELFTFASGNASTPLPITLTSFEGVQHANAVHLNWITSSELNNDFFTVERSADGVEFVALASLKGSGTTTKKHEYLFTDTAPFIGDNYYRLKQTDFDGKRSYSNVIRVSFFGNLKLYPNPASEDLTVEGEALEDALVTITNSVGQKLTLPLELRGKKLSVDLKGTSAGIYFLTINRNGKLETVKFMVK